MLPEPVQGLEKPESGPLLDRFGRAHTYVRVSVTDRCNYRCTYCMPAEGLDWLPRANLLTFEEITRIVSVLARCGVERVRLTGGEPTVRRDLERLVASLAAIPGIRDLSMTTNGHLFAQKARAFAEAGLNRVNISLDSLDAEQFKRITRGGDLKRVLDAIDAARDAGLTPVKINAVIVGGENEDQVEALVERFAPHAATTQVRFIEYMPFDGNDPTKHHVPAAQIRARLSRTHELQPLEARLGGGPAAHWRVKDSGLVVGFISPITEHFCQACNRLRLQADGHLRTCLSRDPAPSLRDLLRAGMTDDQLEKDLRDRLWAKVAGHEAHLDDFKPFEGVMTGIGG
jgi:cyclic pyranopterin phosphate synthase